MLNIIRLKSTQILDVSLEIFKLKVNVITSMLWNSFLGVRYQYIAAPATPTKATTYAASPMGAMALFTSGAVLYNPLSDSKGSLVHCYLRFELVKEV